MDPNNYRPISILSNASKLLERHICQHIYNFFSSYDLLYKAQSGFRPHHSCETALIRLIDMWHKNIEEGQLNGFVLIDFHKVFDMINIDLLLSKLKLYQFDETLLKWMNSYLKERNHSIKINDYLSSLTPITHGVPQGSIIVPLLFIIFVNDLHLSTNLPIDMYADDSTLHTNGKTVAELNEKLTTAVSSVNDWCTSNDMVINEKKTKSMTICTYQKETKIGSCE